MKKGIKKAGIFVLLVLAIGFAQSCKNKEPSVVKIFVRSASNELIEGAKVVIIGDPSSNPATNAYVDTVITNSSGFASFNVEPYFDAAGDDVEVAYYDIIAKSGTKTGFGYVRSRIHTTAVETVFLPL